MVYSGSGAPWQWLQRLSLLWQKIHSKEPSLQFLVITRDKRCTVLAEGINPDNIKFESASSGKEVFQFLQEGCLGFLIREENIVNRVSFPIKFAEYLAAGLNVVVSDFNWSCADFVRENGGGIVINNQDVDEAVLNIINYYKCLTIGSIIEANILSDNFKFYCSQVNLMKLID